MLNGRGWFVLGATLTLLSFLAPPGQARRDATATFAGTPSSIPCRAAPRSFDGLRALFATPIISAPRPTPGTLPRGLPADSQTVAGITATVHELVACFDAGALLRAYGLYTDDYLRRLLARQGPPDRAAYDFFATPGASTDAAHTVIVAIDAVRILPNGQAGATVVLRYPNLPMDKTFFFVFVRVDDRWLIGDIVGEISFAVP